LSDGLLGAAAYFSASPAGGAMGLIRPVIRADQRRRTVCPSSSGAGPKCR
jgi:hypothetical protein